MPDDRKRGQDKYVCVGGDDFWNDGFKNKYTGGRPGLCPPLCEAFDKKFVKILFYIFAQIRF